VLCGEPLIISHRASFRSGCAFCELCVQEEGAEDVDVPKRDSPASGVVRYKTF
jgi:hypothetical protein